MTPLYRDEDEGTGAHEVPRRGCLVNFPVPTTSSEPPAGLELMVCETVSAFSPAGVKGFLVDQPKGCWSVPLEFIFLRIFEREAVVGIQVGKKTAKGPLMRM